MLKEAKERLLNNALQEDILHRIAVSEKSRLKNFLKAFGFGVVELEIVG
ncbi:MAG: hypothetical protein ACI395_03905 [Candidatus Cryptobacteroides sp.]